MDDKKQISDSLKEIRFQKEIVMESDSFNNPIYREGLESLAQVIQNLIIIEKGTYPNQPDLGVGIANYLFEILDLTTISEMKNNIEDQIDKFINHPYINVQVDIKKLEDLDKVKSNTLGIIVTLINTVTNSETSYTYLFAGNNKTKKVVSKLIY